MLKLTTYKLNNMLLQIEKKHALNICHLLMYSKIHLLTVNLDSSRNFLLSEPHFKQLLSLVHAFLNARAIKRKEEKILNSRRIYL